jgi:hypothetical protein
MKSSKKKDTKEQYEIIVKLVKRAEKTAEKFIEQNKKVDPQLQA